VCAISSLTSTFAISSPDEFLLVFIRLEARLKPNIGFTLRRVLAVFTRSAITPPKVNRLG